MKTDEELEAMTRKELSEYIIEITQTPICKNKAYCKKLLALWDTKPMEP